MNIRVRKPRLTAAQFEELDDTHGFELVNGRLREKSVGHKSSWVQRELGHLIRLWQAAGDRGLLFESEAAYACFPDRPRTVRKPDVSYVRTGRFPNDQMPEGNATIPPDLAAEVVSPKDRYCEVERKVSECLSVGVPLVWVVNPDLRTVLVYTGNAITRLTDADELTGDPVLPGFRVRVSGLFPPAAPPAS